MTENIIILNEFEHNEILKEIFVDFDGFVFEELLSVKQEDGSIPIDKILGVSKIIDTAKSSVVILCQKRKDGRCETVACMRNVTWHEFPEYYNWMITRYNIECNAEDAFLIPKKDRLVFESFEGWKIDNSLKSFVKRVSIKKNNVKVDTSSIDKKIRKDCTHNELVEITVEYDDVNQFKKSLALWENKYNENKYDPEVIYQFALSNMDCNNMKTARILMESIFEEKKDNDYYLSRLVIIYFLEDYISNAINILDMIKDRRILDESQYPYEHIMSYAPIHFDSDNVMSNDFIKHKVNLGITDMPLPEVIKSVKGNRYMDLIRKKGVNVTPEETIRQQVLRYLLNICKIPEEEIVCEDHMAHYDKSATIRADITVRSKGNTLLIVECKEPNISIDGEPIKQIFSYNEIMNSKYLLLTNGEDSYIFQKNEKGEYDSIMTLPSYEIMNSSKTINTMKFKKKELKRPSIEEMSDKKVIEQYRNDGVYLGANSKEDIAPFALNLMWGFIDDTVKIKENKNYGIEIVKDQGLVDMVLSNASGGKYQGRYRQFLVKDRNGDDCILSFAVFGTYAVSTEKGGYTSLVCGVNRATTSISRLQLRVDVSCKITGESTYLFHNGSRSRKKCQTTIDYVSSICSELIQDNVVSLGVFPNDKLIKMDDANVQDFITRLCAYVLLRDEMTQKGL